ncbi:MAG: hypothetical protein WCJ71_05020, partial [Candidatus Omnitrophota bacterium]
MDRPLGLYKIADKVKIGIAVFVLSVSLFFSSNVYAVLDGTVTGGTITETETGKRIEGTNVEFVGDWSTPAGFTLDIYATNALLRDNTGRPTMADGIYNFWGSGTLGMINTAGIVFGTTASVQAMNQSASIIISTLNIESNNFFNPVNGERKFFKDGSNSFIINAGRIAAQPGGYIALLSGAVENRGIITVSSIDAKIGRIVLASGEKMTVSLDDRSLISVAIDEGVKEKVFGPDGQMDSAIKNSGTVSANGGTVTLTAKSMNKVFDYAINNTGIIEAKTWVNHDGVIELVAEGAPILNDVSGRIEASKVVMNAPTTDVINRGLIVSETPDSINARGSVEISAARLFQNGLIFSNGGVSINVGSLTTDVNPISTQPGPVVFISFDDYLASGKSGEIPLPVAVIQAKEVRVNFKTLGTTEFPVQIRAAHIYLYRTSGDINILETLGMGTSLWMRGPPSEGFSVVYTKDSNLYLEAKTGNISEAQGLVISARNISLVAYQSIDIKGTLRAVYIVLNSKNGTTTLHPGSVVDVSTNEAGVTGGRVEVLGKNVILFGARILAQGLAGGGTILIGGDFQGRGTVPNSLNVYVSRDTYINADSTGTGDGGRVIVWSDVSTQYHGHISANGGPEGGNGGFVQVASRDHLEFNGFVDATAAKGNRGTFVIEATGTTGYAASLATGQYDYIPGETATITGSGFKAGETVTLVLHHVDRPALADVVLIAVADANGNFSISTLTLQEHDRGVSFTLTAKGLFSGAVAQTKFTDATRTSLAAGGNWNTNGTWVGGNKPAAGDLVVIATTGANTVTTAGNRTCAGLTINSGATLSMANGDVLTVNGNVSGAGTITAGATGRTLNVTGNWTFSGTITAGDAITLNMTGTGAQTLSGVICNGTTSSNLTINKASGTVTLGSAITIAGGTFTLTAGTFDPSTYLLTAGSGTFTAGTLRVGATTWAGNYSFAVTEPAGGTIEYYAAGPQTVNNVNYGGNLTLSGSGVKTLQTGTTTIGGNLTLNGTASTTTVVGLVISGNLDVGSGTTLTVAGFNFT